jgi:hypothetical protein
MKIKKYLVSLPERAVRSAVGLAAGVVREAGDVIIPAGIRRTHLYQNLVDAMLRYLIEHVGGVEKVYEADGTLTENFLLRRSAGNALEVLGIVAFRASPVWVLAALADVCGAGRHLIPEIAEALKAQGLLEQDAQFATVDQMLDGLERTSSRLAATVNTPPLDVAGLRREWQDIRAEAAAIAPGLLPSRETLADLWTQLKHESARQNRSVFEMSSTLALSAAGDLPERLRWLSASAKLAAARSGQVFAAALLDHYRQTLGQIRDVGFVKYTFVHLRPYVGAAVAQFSPRRRTLTDRLIDKWNHRSATRS